MHYARMVLSLAMVLSLIVGVPAASLSQDEAPGKATEGDATSVASGNPINLDSNQDSSLFVGHYRLNPGDTVKIDIQSGTPLTYTMMINEQGDVILPVIGPVKVSGLTATEAREELQKLVDQYYQQAWAAIEILQLGKVKFYVYGDVTTPGFYTATGATTVFDFLQAFGLTSTREHRRIVHVHGNPFLAMPEKGDLLQPLNQPINQMIEDSLALFAKGDTKDIDPRVTIVDPLAFTLQGEIEQRNFFLEFGDVIYVPDPVVSVQLDGFRRSGKLEILPAETWADVIRIAGQPDSTRDPSNMVIERHDIAGQLEQLYYNLNRLSDAELSQIPIENHDTLKVLASETNIYVLGAVNKAGAYAYQANLNPLDYVALAEGTTSQAHIRFAVIVRPSTDPRAALEDSQLIELDLGAPLIADIKPSPVTLQPGDILFIPEKGKENLNSDILTSLSLVVNAWRLF